jgi:hypothetical protein
MAWIYHPKLDTKAQVPASSVPVWTQSGWVPTDPPAPPPAPTVDEDPAPTRRRRTKDQPAAVGAEEEGA